MLPQRGKKSIVKLQFLVARECSEDELSRWHHAQGIFLSGPENGSKPACFWPDGQVCPGTEQRPGPGIPRPCCKRQCRREAAPSLGSRLPLWLVQDLNELGSAAAQEESGNPRKEPVKQSLNSLTWNTEATLHSFLIDLASSNSTVVLLSQFPKCWDSKCEPPCLTTCFLLKKICFLF